MTDFAPPLNKLGDSGIEVAPSPSGGMGLALTPDGKIPAGALFLGSPRRISVGSGTVTFPGAVQVAGATVTHNMNIGSAPYVFATSAQTSGGSATSAYVASVGATTFVVNVFSPTGAPGAGVTADFYWLAIG